MDSDQISLNKYISASGFCSRREADKLIEQARVTVNDEVALAGTRVTPGDVVEVDGEPIKTKKRALYIACNKPVGITSTTDVRDKTNIITFLNHPKRIFPVGRLDKDSDGLILLTNDGDIVNKILRASNNHEKEYIVIVDKVITPEFIQQMSNGVPILGTITKKCVVKQEGSKRFRIVLTQGLNRQIRRMCEYLGYKVAKLTRIRIMNVQLEGLAVGHWRYLSVQEMDRMNDMMKGSLKTAGNGKAKRNKIKPEYESEPASNREARARERKEAFLEGVPKKTGITTENGKTLTARAAKIKRLKEEYLLAKKNDPNRKPQFDEDDDDYDDEKKPAVKKASTGSRGKAKLASWKRDDKADSTANEWESPERAGSSHGRKPKPGGRNDDRQWGEPDSRKPAAKKATTAAERKTKFAQGKNEERAPGAFDKKKPAIKKSSSSRFKGSSHKADKKAQAERGSKPASGNKNIAKKRPTKR